MALDLTGIIEIDLHGLRTAEANEKIDEVLRSAGNGVYIIRCIHGYNRGTNLRSMIYDEYRYEKKIKRIVPGDNPGITILIMKELY